MQLSKAEVARLVHKPEPWVGRRANGSTPFTLDDLDLIESVIGISADYLFTGNAESRRPVGPDGGSSGVVHPPGLEPGTH
ncbi:helix-turn-helix domain-containing protein [Brevibacterium otitidis]|uniref:Helix-turn-helix domain-containing protein n=2 Tax=Brevibacterium TaxID=1696 RepID=A0ABV5X4D2_9MICO